MNQKHIDRFFIILDKHLNRRAKIILTGAAAGSIFGQVRPSLDVDFAVDPGTAGKKSWTTLENAIRKTAKISGIQANYAKDIDRWGQITLLNYRRHTVFYKRFGLLEVYLLDPVYWSIGKMTRYFDPDIRDMISVFKKQKIPFPELARVWGKALRKSPPSTACYQFRKQVEDFINSYGRIIWGARFNTKEAVSLFHKASGIDLSSL